MRLIKMLGLAMVAPIAAMAFIGAGTASAADPNPWFCSANEAMLCSEANLLVPPTGGYLLLLAHSENAELTNNAFFKTPEKCKSDAANKALGEKAMTNPMAGELTELTFTVCTGPCTTVKAGGLPWKAELKMEKEGAGEPWQLASKEGSARLTGCTFKTECEYGVPAGGSVTLKGTNGTEGAVLKAEGVTLEYKAGSGQFTCGPSGTWNAEYKAGTVHIKNADNTDRSLYTTWYLTLLGP